MTISPAFSCAALMSDAPPSTPSHLRTVFVAGVSPRGSSRNVPPSTSPPSVDAAISPSHALTSQRGTSHHLSLTTVVAPGHGLAVTPVFFGANPAQIPARHAHASFRLLGQEEDRAFALIRSLDASARAKAVIADRSLGDIVAGPGRELSLARFEGIALSQLSEGQRDGVLRILELYAGTLRAEIARPALARLRQAGLERLHFAWAGSPERGRPHYFRVHGPTGLVEYDNTQNGANHVRSLWIDPESVFGRDLLRAHYQGAL